MKKILVSLSLLLLSGAIIAQVDRSKMPEPGPAPEIDLGETPSFTLENGLKVFVVENNKLPRVAFSLQLDIDPITEGDKAGAAEIAGELLSKGTKNRTKEELNFSVDYIGARFSTSATSIFASSLKKHQEKILEIMADVVKNSDFKEEELDKIKTQYISGIQTEKDDPDAIARNVRQVLLYGKDHPYGEIPTEETIENITLDDTKNFYETYYKPNVAYMAVVGDINLEEAKKLITNHFGDWKKGEVPTFDYEYPETPTMPEIAFVNKPGAVQSVVSVFNVIDLQPGSEDAIKASIANGILGGGFISKLNLNLREENSFTYGARSSIETDELVGNFYASAKVRNEVTDSALTEMMNEVMEMRKGNVTEDELETIKNYRIGTFSIALENAQTKARYAINIDKYNLPKDYYANYLKKVADITLEDVKEVSNKYINPMKGYILIVGNQEEVADKIKKFSSTGSIKFYDTYGNEKAESELKEAPEGLKAEKVIQDYIEAIGGEKSLNKVESVTMLMEGKIQGMTVDMKMISERPNKFLSEITGNGMTLQKQVFNGSEGQSVSPQGSTMMEEEDIAAMKIESEIFPEQVYTNEGYTLTLKGVDTKNEQEVYVVEVLKPTGKKETNYYSTESGLKVLTEKMEESPMGEVMTTTSYDDYKAVKKVMFPYSMVETAGPQKFEVSVKEVNINDKIEKGTFDVKE